ncbi:MAG: enoyl-CoA hydratase/isomerase family protein [Hydrogenophaga sp.]|uniref:enoyl-CoA hydratase/isomerase family protein n=1 Tax=Hydrogenophaga sp. TaxID=1904254 RepID=UPI000EE78D57|nr:enoyl-CoA hydratase/isomerase family protein [Hydrogenophaga sp.]MDD3786690.1 enoyl-CoA hydratase/isomerase family protein [Hydrogenophaga sp.]HAJ13450.1 enoyl-CoA hydratase/isomerase family protein [Comamonadaceae bacterium]
MTDVLLDKHGHVSVVTLNRPARLNAIGGSLLHDLHTALLAAQQDPDTRVIVFTGAGRAFCAGDDLREFDEQTASPERVQQICDDIQRITRDLMHGPKLVIGAIQGYAVGGGFEWLLNCDMVVAADDLVCFFPEMQWGHFVTGGVTHLLPQTVGYQRAMELIVLGERIDAQRLLSLGLVNRVVTREMLLDEAMALATQVAERAPHALALLKKALNGLPGPLSSALETERDAAAQCFAHPETARRVRTFGAGS